MIWSLVLLAIVAVPFVAEWLRRPMGPLERQFAPGNFAELPKGLLHYRWSGPQDGPVLVAIHGLTTPSFVWDAMRPGLEAQGFRVLCYDHYGRGYSDRPAGAQDAAFFVHALEGLLDHLGVDEKVTLLGYSMGGAVAAEFAATYPDRVAQVILLAPAGMGHDLGPTARLTQTVPGLGDWLFHVFFPRAHRKGVARERLLASVTPHVFDLQLAELGYRGFLGAVLASLRGILSRDCKSADGAIAASGLPVLAIWGDADTVIPILGSDVLKTWNADARHIVLPGAGHGLAYTHASDVLDAVATG